MYTGHTDEALMELLKGDDSRAFRTLFDRYYKPLCQFCTVYTKDNAVAEEIISNLFIKIWDNRNEVNILNLRSYFFTSAKNLSLNYLQKKKDPIDAIEDVDEQQPTFHDTNTPFKILSSRESYSEILNVIDTLPDSQRRILLMSHIDSIDKHDIAKTMGISVRTVETTLYQSIKKVRHLLRGFQNSNSGS